MQLADSLMVVAALKRVIMELQLIFSFMPYR